MKSTRLFTALVLAAAAALFLSAARADDTETSTIKFSDPARPGTLKVAIANGDLHIHGADAGEVTVRTEIKPEAPAQRKDGLRVLTSSSSYSLTEKDNVVTLSYGNGAWPNTGGGDFDLTVPRNTSVIVSSSLGGDIEIGDVTGSLEVKSLNGEVKLGGVSGGALVETMNGEIKVDVVALVEGKPLSFSSMNGEVQINLPADAKASVRLRTHNGSILTDFDDRQLVTKTASLKADHSAPRALSSADAAEIRHAVHDAVRVGMEAAREATRAARDAVREARRSTGNADDNEADNDSEDLAPVPPMPPMPPLPPMTGGKIVTGTLNGGGPEIRVTTMNGDVTLRKLEAK